MALLTRTLVLILFFMFTIQFAFGGVPIEKFKVKGNCETCEKSIEEAALKVDGVANANWNKKTKTIVVSFDTSKTDVQKISKAIAKAGYDTEMHKASDEAYNSLPGCCRYERNDSSYGKVENHQH